jgi:hypothetical protein
MKFNGPVPVDLTVLREWLDRKEGGNSFFKTNTEANLWSEENEHDLITLGRRNEDIDRFTLWVYGTLIPWVHQLWGHKREVGQPTTN